MLAYFCVYCVFIFVSSLSVFSVIRFLKLVLGLIFEKLHDIGEEQDVKSDKPGVKSHVILSKLLDFFVLEFCHL